MYRFKGISDIQVTDSLVPSAVRIMFGMRVIGKQMTVAYRSTL